MKSRLLASVLVVGAVWCAHAQSTPPQITAGPFSLVVTQGANAVFSVTATGPGPLTYSWGAWCPPDDPRWPDCGCTPFPPCAPNLPAFTLSKVSPNDAGGYYVVVSNPFGAATSQVATLTVTNPAPVPPQIVGASWQRGAFTLSFLALVGYLHEVQYKDSLSDSAWSVLDSGLATSTPVTVTDPQATLSRRFYRVVSKGPLTAPVTPHEPPQGGSAQPGAAGGCSMPGMDDSLPYLFSGEFHHEETDLVIKGRGLDFIWKRTYRSKLGSDTAQGKGWDFSYNIRVQPGVGGFDVWDGAGRVDTYRLQPGGIYAASQLFNEGTISNTVFRLRFPDMGLWEFMPLDGSPSQGRIALIRERNGNTLSFQYDGLGRLVTIVDTLGRPVIVNYNPENRIASVTDFVGRQVTYTYYPPAGDTNGTAGDLKTATSPVVAGTPNGNDFPAGKTVTYTYATGFGDDRLNHNLRTITDAKGQTWLRNTYAAITDPADFNFDRLLSQARGYSNEVLAFYYKPQAPIAGNLFAVTKAIVNDRVGNVSEYLFDATNRPVRLREFTGRCVAGLTVTETLNRPTAKLRATDPDFFETRWEWNGDSKPTRILYPNGNSVTNIYEASLNPAVGPRFRANLRARTMLPGPLGGDQASITETFLYDTTFGGCCGFNFVTQETDGRGNTRFHSYDSRGNRTNTIHALPSAVETFAYNSFGQMTSHTLPANGSNYSRQDVMVYYTSGPQNGYLKQQIVDAPTLALTTTFEYDAVGNVTRIIDPKGNDSSKVYNSLNQVVREISREVTTGSGIRYTNDYFYDANNNRVRVDIQNTDDQGVNPPVLPVITTTYDFDVLNHPVRSTQMVTTNHNVVTELAYDANHQKILSRSGQAASGAEPTNTIATLYDERKLQFREIRGPGTPAQATTQFDYDKNANLVKTSQGLESEPRHTTGVFDGYDRRTAEIDAIGNMTTRHFDANGNLVSERVDGGLNNSYSDLEHVRLQETTYLYDELNRRTHSSYGFFIPITQQPIGGGVAMERTVYAPDSKPVAEIDAAGFTNHLAYDTVGRRSVATDAKGNTVHSTYDANGNELVARSVDKSSLGGPDRTNTVTYTYDNLDRPIRSVNDFGHTNRMGYDSRNNPSMTQDGKGNMTRYVFDGLGRIIQKTRIMTDNGAGNGNPVGTIVTLQTWDDSSRLVSQTDDNTNTTYYYYDAQNRRVRTVFADGTSENTFYDSHNNKVSYSDRNGTVVLYTHDLLNRVVTNTIIRAPGVGGSTVEYYQYDGLSRLVRAGDNDTLVTRDYDSLDHVIRETQLWPLIGPVSTVTSTYDGRGDQTQIVYPGGRVIGRAYDEEQRLSQVQDISGGNTTIASYKYHGHLLEERDYGNGTHFIPTYDNLRRMTNILHLGPGMIIDNRALAWDENNNKTTEIDQLMLPPAPRSFHYDSADRLVHSDNPRAGQFVDYTFDGAGNRRTVTGNVDPGVYTLNPTQPSPDDFRVNRYTATPFDTRTYDRNGNLLTAGANQYIYDYHNHLIQFNDLGKGVTYNYVYDVMGRRVAKVSGSVTNRYCYNRDQEIEEQDGAGNTVATFVWGNGIDDLLQMVRGGQVYYFHSDDQESVLKVTTAAGSVVEAYEYGDYGTPTILDSTGIPQQVSPIGNFTLYNGRRYDPELGWYYYRTRYLDPRAGRFVSCDSVGIWTDDYNWGNGFTYVGNNPWSHVDPMGTKKHKKSGGGGNNLVKKLVQKGVKAIVKAVTPKPVVGVDGKLDLCAEFTSGDWDLSGSLWIGAGVKEVGHFVGVSYKKNGKIAHGNEPNLKWFEPKGTCASSCTFPWLKIGGRTFPLTGSYTYEFPPKGKGPLECEAHVGVKNCTGTIGASCEADFIEYIGGPAVAEIARAAAKMGVQVQAGATGSMEVQGCYTTDNKAKLVSAKACLGAFVRVGINVSEHP